MTTYIQIGIEKVRKDVEVRHVGFDVSDSLRAWEQVRGATHYYGDIVACRKKDADEVETQLRDAGFNPTGRRPVYAVQGPEGDMIHEVYED